MNDQARMSYNERLEAWKDKNCESLKDFPVGKRVEIMGVECVIVRGFVEKVFEELQFDLIFRDGGSLGKITLTRRALVKIMEDGGNDSNR